MNKTGDLKIDTSDLEITVIEKLDTKGRVYYQATDQFGNTDTARDRELAEKFVRAKVDIQR